MIVFHCPTSPTTMLVELHPRKSYRIHTRKSSSCKLVISQKTRSTRLVISSSFLARMAWVTVNICWAMTSQLENMVVLRFGNNMTWGWGVNLTYHWRFQTYSSLFRIIIFGHGKQWQRVEYGSKFETRTPDLILMSGAPIFLDSSQILSQKESPIQNITILPIKSKKTIHVLSPRNAQHLHLNAIELIKACPGASLRRNIWDINWEIYYNHVLG